MVALPRLITAALWLFLALTAVATAYFGWHCLIDDVAGLALGGISVLVAERVTRRAGPVLAVPVVPSSHRERIDA